MYKLVVNPDKEQAWEIQLRPGGNRIGRGPDNDFQIDDPSVSTSHCLVIVRGDHVRLCDLQSTNGTFVDACRINETRLQPGQRLRFGSVEIRFERIAAEVPVSDAIPSSKPASEASSSGGRRTTRLIIPPKQTLEPAPGTYAAPRLAHDDTPAPASQPPQIEIETPEPIFCKNHFQTPAHYQCPKCNRFVCDICVNTGGGVKTCKICSSICVPVSLKAHRPKSIDFFQSVPGAFKYPIEGDGWFLLITGAVFFGILDVAVYVSLNAMAFALRAFMLRALILAFALGTGYLFSYLKKIAHSTAIGDKRMPDWPEFTEWQSDIVYPMFQFLLVSLFSYGPALLSLLFFDSPWIPLFLALAGSYYFPMALLGVAMFDSLMALNPQFIIASILRVPREYAVAAGVFLGIILFRAMLVLTLKFVLPIKLVPELCADVIGIYLLIVQTRILGLLFLSKKSILGWYPERKVKNAKATSAE